MNDCEPFVDIHCHLLPGIDDGAADWDETLAMARMAVADGFSTIVATPHQLGSFAQNQGEQIRAAVVHLQMFLEQHQVPLRVLPGADVRIEAGMLEGLKRGDVLSMGDHRRHVLLELPHELYVPLDRLIVELQSIRMIGILSHPERNQGILSQPALLRPLVAAGCLMQVTAGSLTGGFGAAAQKLSTWMLDQGLVHFVSTDAHSTRSRKPQMSPAFAVVAERMGVETAFDLCCRNPALVAAGRNVVGGVRLSKVRGRSGWLRWKKAA